MHEVRYQPIQYYWVHTCPLPRLPSSYMPFAYVYPTSSSTQTGEHLVYHLMLLVWTRPNANQYHVCTVGSGIGGMGGGGGGGGGGYTYPPLSLQDVLISEVSFFQVS